MDLCINTLHGEERVKNIQIKFFVREVRRSDWNMGSGFYFYKFRVREVEGEFRDECKILCKKF
jgi:hypothetical protein